MAERGIYRKYKIERTDGSSAVGGKHAECSYFVLDLAHDDFARAALVAYARACSRTHPELARDIKRILAVHPCGCRAAGECHHWGMQTPSDAMAAACEESDEADAEATDDR